MKISNNLVSFFSLQINNYEYRNVPFYVFIGIIILMIKKYDKILKNASYKVPTRQNYPPDKKLYLKIGALFAKTIGTNIITNYSGPYNFLCFTKYPKKYFI